MTDTAIPAATARRGSAALWYALFGGASAWFAGLCIGYFLVTPACVAGSELPVHLVALVTIAAGAGAVVSGARLWRSSDAHWPNEGGSRRDRTRFLAALGTLLSALFTLVMIAQWLAAVLHGPCAPHPRLDDSPDACVDHAEPAHFAGAARGATFERSVRLA